MKTNTTWIIKISIITFGLSILFSLLSSSVVDNIEGIIPALLILVLIILIGIIFDLIGVSVTIADEKELNAMASKRIKGAKKALQLHKDSPRISNICADVIGDICGVLSGSLGAMIAIKIMNGYGISFNLEIIVSALIAAITVSGKAYTKEIAKNNATAVLLFCAKLLEPDFSKKRK